MDLVSTLSYKNASRYLSSQDLSEFVQNTLYKIKYLRSCRAIMLHRRFIRRYHVEPRMEECKKLPTTAPFEKVYKIGPANNGAMHRFGDSLSIPGNSAIRGDPSTATSFDKHTSNVVREENSSRPMPSDIF